MLLEAEAGCELTRGSESNTKMVPTVKESRADVVVEETGSARRQCVQMRLPSDVDFFV